MARIRIRQYLGKHSESKPQIFKQLNYSSSILKLIGINKILDLLTELPLDLSLRISLKRSMFQLILC